MRSSTVSSYLRNQFQEIWIPIAVEAELRDLKDSFALARIDQGLQRGWIRPRTVTANPLVRLLRSELDRGEAEAITLAIELHVDIILLDERAARDIAARAGLRVTGVLGVLLRAKQQGDIPAVKQDLENLRTKARFFITPRLEQQVLALAGE